MLVLVWMEERQVPRKSVLVDQELELKRNLYILRKPHIQNNLTQACFIPVCFVPGCIGKYLVEGLLRDRIGRLQQLGTGVAWVDILEGDS